MAASRSESPEKLRLSVPLLPAPTRDEVDSTVVFTQAFTSRSSLSKIWSTRFSLIETFSYSSAGRTPFQWSRASGRDETSTCPGIVVVYDGPVQGSDRTQPEVVVVGGSNIDIQGQSRSVFLSGDSNPGSIRRTAGGVGRNIAENCVRLGLSVALVTAFGDDEGSAWLEDTCQKSGISTAESLRVPGPCAAYLCLLDSDG